MFNTYRFGRRIALPSTRQIKHELRLFSAHEDARLSALADKNEAKLEPSDAGPHAAGEGFLKAAF